MALLYLAKRAKVINGETYTKAPRIIDYGTLFISSVSFVVGPSGLGLIQIPIIMSSLSCVRIEVLYLKHRMLLIGSVIAIPIGIILWRVIGPVILLSGVKVPEDFFPAYPWLSNPNPTTHQVFEVTAAYWVGLVLTTIGFFISVAGVIGIIINFVLEYLGKNKTKR